ncbi:DUF2490 domain-containing protein [Kaistella yonginensis]|uniref:DUF2490 domain-containing protein n=1 Tax=Kaistella yonginensis TaxID=658267 RepID=UPI0025B46314|nr:DUF2490 domain-containing protein [Kaistella yonginensis]MDN3605767.1 DUF2490 domain-containing protein [Kaistella yonginensis]
MFKLKIFFFLIAVISIDYFKAQVTFQVGLLPSVVLTDKMSNDWSVIYEIDSRQLLSTRNIEGVVDNKYEFALTDFSVLAAKKISHHSRLAGGYLLRIEDDEISHRYIQQYTLTHQLRSLPLSHRFASDQTFSSAEKPSFRLRYRIATEIPLMGETVDADELYFKMSNEFLNSWQDSEYDLEVRLVPLLGFNFKNEKKLEMGLDYRLDSFLQNKTRHSFWVSVNLLVEL